MFLAQVEGPVVVEVAAADVRSELEDGFGSVQSPPGSGDVHAVFDQPSGGAFDHAGGDRPALGQGGGVVEVWPFGGQVAGARVGAGRSAGE